MKKRNYFLSLSRSGFTYIEAVMAVMIASIIAVYLAFSIPASYSLIQQTEQVQKATDLAQKYLETVKSELAYKSKYDLALEGSTPPVSITSDFTNNGYYTITTNITDLETSIINSANVTTLKQIDISLKRTGATNNLVSLSTIISRPGN